MYEKPLSTNLSEIDYLFPSEELYNLGCWSEFESELSRRKLLIRPLRSTDYAKGYLQLLSQLTEVGSISQDSFIRRFEMMKASKLYKIVVIEDVRTKKVIGTTTLFFEFKYIHQCALRGRIEEVVILDDYRGQNLGQLLIRFMVEFAKSEKICYKLTLDCKDNLVEFYGRNGFKRAANLMEIRF